MPAIMPPQNGHREATLLGGRTMARFASRLALGVAFAAAFAAVSAAHSTSGATDWPSTNYDQSANRYSPLDQITARNVGTLQQVWSFHLKPAGYTGRLREDEAIPIVIGNTMYLGSPYGAVHALDATTGAEKWKFQLPNNDVPSKRGVAYWPGGGGAPAVDHLRIELRRAVLLKASDGALNSWFGENGVVNLKTPEVMQTGMSVPYSLLSSPIIYKNLIITGAGTGEGPGGSNGGSGPAGDTRAWDARTGKLVWTFHTVPRPGEFGYDTWGGDSAKNRSGVNVWGYMSLDARARHSVHAARRAEQRPRRHRPSRQQSVLVLGRRGRCEHRQVSLALPARASRHLGLRHPVGAASRRPGPGRDNRSRRHHRQQDRTCCSRSIASPANRSSTSTSARCRRATCLASRRLRRSRSRSSPSR